MPQLSQQQRVIAIMCINKEKRWWKPHEIMNTGSGEFFVGYEASARMSELAAEYPDMIESRREGKYFLRRMKFETGKYWYPKMPKHIQEVIKKYYKKSNHEQVNLV